MNRDALIAKLQGAEGYLSDDEAWALFIAVRHAATVSPAPRIVEVGSYKGRSTIAIASALAMLGRGSVVAVDPHGPTGKASYTVEHGDQDTYAEFQKNVATAGVADYVTSLRAISREARRRYDMRPIDMLFIDGSHDYDDVLADIDAWTPLLNDGAVVAFNDTYAPGVNRALRRRLLSSRLHLRNFQHVNNTLFAIAHPPKSTPIPALERLALAWYLYVERLRFRLLKLALRGFMETLGIIYVRPSSTRSPSWDLFPSS